MSTDTDAELTYGALDFLGDTFHALGDNFSTGTPEALLLALPRLLLDGEIITHERDGNRDLTFQVQIEGDDVLALNEAEAELVREVNKPRNTLRWKPEGMNTPVTVFDTFAGVVAQVFDDLEEMRGKRVYSVTIPALPHARSETLHTASLAGRSSVTTLDNCDSTTGWTGPSLALDTSVKVQGTGSLKVTASATVNADGSGTAANLQWKRSGLSVSAAAGFSVVASLRSDFVWDGPPWLQVTASGVTSTAALVSAVATANGWTEYTWALGNEDPVTVTAIDIRPVVGTRGHGPGTYSIHAWLDNVLWFTDAPPADLAGLRLLDTGGSVRTPGTLRLSNTSTALGSVLVATWADLGDGYRPDCARWYTAGGTRTSDSASVSGFKFTTTPWFDVPNRTLAPGPYTVWVKPSVATFPSSVIVTAQTVIGGTAVGPSESVTANMTAPAGIVPLGIVHLPAAATPVASAGVTRLTVDINGATGASIDELWLCRVEDAQVTWLEALTTRRVWLESPSPDLPYGGVWVGDAADMSDARHPGAALRMLGRHVFESPVAAVYVAATGAAPAMDLLHYRTWHSNAAD